MIKLKSINGGKICKECKGACCSSCAHSIGYYTWTPYDLSSVYPSSCHNEEKRLSSVEMATIRAAQVAKTSTERKGLVKMFATMVGATFDEKTGFNGPNGCTIPRNKRSSVCRNYTCHKLDKAMKL